eukprot:g1392.t1
MPLAPAAPRAPLAPGAPPIPGGLPPDWTEHKDPTVLQQQCYEEPDLPHRIFGGPSRLHDLKTFFETLVTLERQVVIITNGFGAVVEAALEKADLLRYFSEVIGRDHPLSAAKQAILVDDDPANVVPSGPVRGSCRHGGRPS